MENDARVADIRQAGKLRGAIGLTPIAITKDPGSGEMRGVALDLGQALAAAIGVELAPIIYPRPGAVIDGLRAGEWDVAISLGIDPVRASQVDFSPPYLEVDLTYLVRSESDIRRVPEADRSGVRIGVPRGDLADILLTRQLQQAKLVRAETVIGAPAVAAGQAGARRDRDRGIRAAAGRTSGCGGAAASESSSVVCSASGVARTAGPFRREPGWDGRSKGPSRSSHVHHRVHRNSQSIGTGRRGDRARGLARSPARTSIRSLLRHVALVHLPAPIGASKYLIIW
jgi:hypothetical protein